MPPHFWLWAVIALGTITIVYWRIAQGQIESRRAAVMAKQRAVAHELGPHILPFRDQIEAWVQELAQPYPGDSVKAGFSYDALSVAPGVYLRMRLSNAKDVKSIRAAAKSSLLDGFTSCFFIRVNALDPSQGPSCHTTGDCAAGLLCNEWHVCSEPPKPYNMRLAYRALRVLSTEWTDEVHQAESELALTAYDRDLDSVTRRDVPVAIELLSRSKYFTLVLDEDPAEGLPAEITDAGETAEERVQRSSHPARVAIWDLKSKTLVLRVRAEASAQFIQVGERVVRNAANLAAQQRQANNCELALDVRAALEKAGPASQ